MIAKASFSANANVNLRPQGSHIVLTVLGLLAGTCLCVSAYMLTNDLGSGWAFMALAVFLAAAIVWCWNRSQRDVDWGSATPTAIVLSDGTSVKTDSRLLSSASGLQGFGQLLTTLGARQPLPAPSGLVDAAGVVIPNSANEAQSQVEALNAELAALTEQAIKALRYTVQGSTVEQGAAAAAVTLPPTTYQPSDPALNSVSTEDSRQN